MPYFSENFISSKKFIITTIQKFPYISEDIVALGDKKFAVIIDEVHSSQNGELSKGDIAKPIFPRLESGKPFIIPSSSNIV